MAILIGAIAHRLSPAETVEQHMNLWESVREYENTATMVPIKCPRCNEVYALVEDIHASNDTVEEDKRFLAKALGSAHPVHPRSIVVRDPQSLLRRAMTEAAELESSLPANPPKTPDPRRNGA